MLNSKRIILAWLLLLIPTLLLGIGALRLLRSEDARLLAASRTAAEDRAAAIVANIDLAVAEVEDGLLEALRSFSPADLEDQLDSWQRTNPLVRNTFIWQAGQLTWPDPDFPANFEEEAFIRRYQPLFENGSDWLAPAPDVIPAPAAAPTRDIFTSRKELRELAQQAPPAPAADYLRSAAPASEELAMADAEPVTQAAAKPSRLDGESGWRSWYADDQLHLIGWFSPTDSDRRYGVEVEMMALLSRLLVNLPPQPPAGERIALLDGSGAIFHQVVSPSPEAETIPFISLTLTSLPHWRLAIYGDPAAASSSSILLFGSLLIGTFVVAILLGGALLLRQVYREQRDARQKTSFVSNVSHELKTPLTTIRMYAEMLAEGNIGDHDKQQRYLHTIVRESQRLTRLVGNILDFSRLEQGRRSYRSEEIDLTELLAELLATQQVRLDEAGLRLTRDFTPGLPPLNGDRDAIEQIVLNLLDNAVKYATEGERLELDLTEDDGWLLVRLRDYGPGIPAAHRKRIFDKFHRVDNSLTTSRQGSGLGLSIARQLAEGLGGRLDYRPVSGGGSCFELRLPVRKVAR
ncbi:MAG: hypothetical protein C0622_06975 [Desulfuromonas sp.]|nr:MAG: hypothetical protein C0622_06975 [Desulfuromonas sp.]